MKLFINTNLIDDQVEISIKDNKNNKLFRTIFTAKHCQAEKLLLEIDNLLKKYNLQLVSIDEIEVENRGEGFTSLRIGVLTANALGYALKIKVNSKAKSKKVKGESKFDIIKPVYSQKPNISNAKKKFL